MAEKADWRPGTSREALLARAELLAQLRVFMAKREITEVDTPLLARFTVTDPAIESLRVRLATDSVAERFLQTSPEFAMKRLLAAGLGPIYQLGKVFRQAEHGARHNPEFTMLEWYRPGFDLRDLVAEVGELVATALGRHDWEVVTYRELFRAQLAVDPWTCATTELEKLALQHLDLGAMSLNRDAWMDLLMTHCVEPSLQERGMVFVVDYPPSQAALARLTQRDDVAVADRFELYVDGMELANGYRELLDASELEQRADADNRRRVEEGQSPHTLDPRLLAAMREGLPDCSGVALGVDRLLMLRLGESQMQAVMPFDWSRC